MQTSPWLRDSAPLALSSPSCPVLKCWLLQLSGTLFIGSFQGQRGALAGEFRAEILGKVVLPSSATLGTSQPLSTCHMRGRWADSKNSELGLAQSCAQCKLAEVLTSHYCKKGKGMGT